jgi:FMN phosphatase YigB (HAD superfamily)
MTPGRVMRRVLERAGILGFFSHCTFSNELGVTKRWRQAFTSTLASLGVPPGEALHVGDSPEADLRGAKAVGMRAALLLQNNPHPEGIPLADLVLDKITDLPGMLDNLYGGIS